MFKNEGRIPPRRCWTDNNGETLDNVVGQYPGGHGIIQNDRRHDTKSKCAADESKGRLIGTWRKHIQGVDEKTKMTIKATLWKRPTANILVQ